MAVPKRRNVLKNRALRAYFQDLHKRQKEEEPKVSEEEHNDRLKKLKDIGLIKDG